VSGRIDNDLYFLSAKRQAAGDNSLEQSLVSRGAPSTPQATTLWTNLVYRAER